MALHLHQLLSGNARNSLKIHDLMCKNVKCKKIK